MADKNEAESKVKAAIAEVENEQGSFASIGSEPPKDMGHSSAPSAGVSGNKVPGGSK